MRWTKLSHKSANRIWSILVEHAGASEMHRNEFLIAAKDPGISEFRFSGKLGFGGKFWASRFEVDCYPEDENKKRKKIIENTNNLLKIELERRVKLEKRYPVLAKLR